MRRDAYLALYSTETNTSKQCPLIRTSFSSTGYFVSFCFVGSTFHVFVQPANSSSADVIQVTCKASSSSTAVIVLSVKLLLTRRFITCQIPKKFKTQALKLLGETMIQKYFIYAFIFE